MEQIEKTIIKLRHLIDNATHGSDGRIPPERALASRLGVGRRSLRRALDVLESEGRILRHQGRGTYVCDGNFLHARDGESSQSARKLANGGEKYLDLALSDVPDHTNPLEVIEVRLAIEPMMARMAAFRASRAQMKRLFTLADETRKAGDPATYENADGRFHRAIAEAARNSLFLAIFNTVHATQRDRSWRRLGENAHCYKRQSIYADFHHRIAGAIGARDGDQAQELMQRHLRDVQSHIHRHAFPGGGTTQ